MAAPGRPEPGERGCAVTGRRHINHFAYSTQYHTVTYGTHLTIRLYNFVYDLRTLVSVLSSAVSNVHLFPVWSVSPTSATARLGAIYIFISLHTTHAYALRLTYNTYDTHVQLYMYM